MRLTLWNTDRRGYRGFPMRNGAQILLIASLAVVPFAARACEVDHFNFVWGSDVNPHMALRTTETCRFGFRVSSRGHMDSMAMTQTPQHGSLSPVDATHWVYKPARGFTGQDIVSIKASGNQMSSSRHISSGDTTINWTVDVSP